MKKLIGIVINFIGNVDNTIVENTYNEVWLRGILRLLMVTIIFGIIGFFIWGFLIDNTWKGRISIIGIIIGIGLLVEVIYWLGSR